MSGLLTDAGLGLFLEPRGRPLGLLVVDMLVAFSDLGSSFFCSRDVSDTTAIGEELGSGFCMLFVDDV